MIKITLANLICGCFFSGIIDTEKNELYTETKVKTTYFLIKITISNSIN